MSDQRNLTELQNDLDVAQTLINEARTKLERNITILTHEMWQECDAALRDRQAVLNATKAQLEAML